MKKLLLLLAGLAVMTACSNSDSKPDPDPAPPKPTGPVSINRTTATISTLDTIHVFLLNYDGEIQWEATDIYMLGVDIKDPKVLTGLAFGEVTISTTVEGKKYSCTVTVNKVVEERPYDLPYMTWGADKATVMTEAAKTATFTEEEALDGGLALYFEQNDPTAPKGQLIAYVIDDKDGLVQVQTLPRYNDENEAGMAWLATLERCMYLGQDEDKYDLGVDRESERFYAVFSAGTLTADNTDVLILNLFEPKKTESAPRQAVKSFKTKFNVNQKTMSYMPLGVPVR